MLILGITQSPQACCVGKIPI